MVGSARLLKFAIPLVSLLTSQIYAQGTQATITGPATQCSEPNGFANTLVRAQTGNSPLLGIKLSFLTQHILFSYTDTNTAIPQADFARFCLDQCIGWAGGSSNVTEGGSGSAATPIGGKGTCKSFTVDMGKPVEPTENGDTALRWWCEGFDEYLKTDLSDYERPNGTGSYMYGIGVNRGCGGGLRYV